MRNVRPGDVGVQQADLGAVASEADRQVDRHGRLADPALAGGHGDRVAHAGDEVGGRPPEAALDVARPVDPHEARAQRRQRVTDVVLDRRLERARGRGELDGQVDDAAVDRDLLHHPERHEVATDLGVLHPAERGEDVLVCQLIGHGRARSYLHAGPMRPTERSRARSTKSGPTRGPVADDTACAVPEASPSKSLLADAAARRDGDGAGGKAVVLGREVRVADLGTPVVEWAGGPGLRHVTADRRQLELRELAELERQRRLGIGSVPLGRGARSEDGHRGRGHDQVVELGGAPGDLVLLDDALVCERLGGALVGRSHGARQDDVVGVAGDPVGTEAQDHLGPMHANRLDDPADEVVEVRSIEIALGVVEHPHHADAEDGDAPAQLVLADGVEVAPVDLAELEVAVLAARCGRLVGESRVEPAAGDADDHDVCALGRGTGDRTPEPERLVARMGDDHHQAARRRALPDGPPDGGHGRQYTGLGADLDGDRRVPISARFAPR